MKKQLLIGLLLLISTTIFAQTTNNKYEADWKQIAEYESDSQPQSASLLVDKILKKAIADNNSTQVVKSLIHKNKYKLQIDNSNKEGIFSDLESLISKTDNASEKALLHSMLGELYVEFYRAESWRINQRTSLIDTVPSDMKEWSSNIFIDKIIQNLNLSIKDIDVLKQHTTKDYSDIIALGAGGQKYYPTLYDFLMDRAIQVSKEIQRLGQEEFDISSLGVSLEQLVLPADEYIKLEFNKNLNNKYITFIYYQRYLKDLLSRSLIPTVIITEIDKINYLENRSRTFKNEQVLNAYRQLEKKYKDNDACAEIINAMIVTLNSDYESPQRNETIYNLARNGIQQYPDYFRIDILKNSLNKVEEPTLRVVSQKLFYPNTPVGLSILYKNTQALPEAIIFALYQEENNVYKLIKEYSPNLVSRTTYNEDSLKLDIGKLGAGKYFFADISKDNYSKAGSVLQKDTAIHNKMEFIVSALMSFSRNSAINEYEIFVVDRNTGKPVENATVNVYPFSYNEEDIDFSQLKASLKTNDLGIALYKDTTNLQDKYRYSAGTYKVILGADSSLWGESLYAGSYTHIRNNSVSNRDEEPTINIFTDRNIYRPGQTVYYKAIVIDSKSKVLANMPFTVKLNNPNGELVSEKELRTNEFGSVSGEFILPQLGLLGQYYIDINGTTFYFSVEEYKRPTFEVTFDKIDKTYTFGEEIKLKGYAKNFSGINLQNAGVQYTITREQFSFWFWRTGNVSHFADGKVETKDDGSFEIVFTPQAGDGKQSFLRKQIYTFNVTATVTDLNGETQSNTYRVTVGDVSMVINIDMPDQMEKASDYKLNIGAKNLDGQDLKKSGSYIVYALNQSDSIQNKVAEGVFETGEQTELKNKLKGIASGKYQLRIKALDDKGNEITEQKNFVLYSYNDKRPPFETNAWVVTKNLVFSENKPVEVIYGVTDKDVYVLYQLYNNAKVFERKYIKLSNINKLFTVAYKDEFGDELYMSFTYIKYGKLYHRNILLTKEKVIDDPNLNLKLEVFRDKLRPGQEETWTISVKDADAQPAKAELLASMYDTSLDKLNPYSAWSFSLPYIYKEYLYPVNFNYSSRYSYNQPNLFYLNFDSKPLDVKRLYFDQINWFGYPSLLFEYQRLMFDSTELDEYVVLGFGTQKKESLTRSVSVSGVRSSIALQGKMAGVSVADAMSSPNLIESEDTGQGAEAGGAIPSSAPQIRRNFNETAFFFPQLRTNEKGETLISFTVPESNTTWRFRALAHDKNSKTGQLEQLVVTRKELMITPNMPRFVRQGDKTSISTKISNLSENAISGDVRIEFFNPLTDKVIDLNIANQKQTFSIEKDASSSASWLFDVPTDIELIGCRIVAQNELFSDGEQHVLAVLPNRMLVTESMPIEPMQQLTTEQIANNATLKDSFTFDKLYNNTSVSSSNYKLTLEFASNPAWYAVQALPVLSNPNNENAVNWFASYYVNTLGASIVRQYPKVGAMIEAWMKRGGSKETLVSKLQKDEELKAVLLEETPWVLDAKNETEQMQRLSLLFDLNNTKQQTDVATKKLAELQETRSGGWTWYKGMYSSRAITQYILYGYAKLQLVGQVEYPQQIKEMQISALRFIDKEITADFVNLKKQNTKWEEIKNISTNQLEYLYVRSSYRDIPISHETREAERFYTSVVSKNWTKLNLYERSLLLMVLQRNGEKALVNKIAKSIREHAVTDKKMGMYWPNNRSNAFMSQSAVSTHVFLMDALKETGASEQEMNQMKRWLLKQKQIQKWESTHATIDAIGALLSTGSDWFAESTTVNITVGNQKVEPENKELGTGYFKETWSKSEINNNMGKVEIEYNRNEPAYGALYWQYYEDLNKITAQKGELNVEKLLLKETITGTGKGLVQVTENNPLTVGDKVIVRLTVRVDRDMEFVQLKDMRAPCFEPLQTMSGTNFGGGLFYYQMVRDASTNFYFDTMPKGTYVFEYPVYVNRSGEYSNGITTIQCMYAPEFVSHTQGINVTVKDKE